MPFIAFDVETTGFHSHTCDIIEIGAVKFDAAGNILDKFASFVNIGYELPDNIKELTNISDSMLRSQGKSSFDAMAGFLMFILPETNEENILLAHNARFDAAFITAAFRKEKLIVPSLPVCDTLAISKYCAGTVENHKLGTLVKAIGESAEGAHRADEDADFVRKIFMHYTEKQGAEKVRNCYRPMDLKTFEKDIRDSFPLSFLPIVQKQGKLLMNNIGQDLIFEEYDPLYIYVSAKKQEHFLFRSDHKLYAPLCEKVSRIP